MRDLINIVAETVGDDLALNQRIEALLPELPYEDAMILDALELAKDAGEDGISLGDFATSMRSLHGELSTDELKVFARHLLTKFDFCVGLRAGSGKIRWRMKDQNMDIDPDLAAAATPQIQLTYRILDIMRDLGRFTERDILPAIEQLGLQPHTAKAFFEHVLATFGGKTITRDGEYFIFRQEKAKSSSDHIEAMKRGL